MTIVDVERIRFEFGATWTFVEKYDDSAVYRDGIGKLPGSKAVDIVGVRAGRLYLIEVKDFRGHAIENKDRQKEDLAIEIGSKVRDTLSGLIGAHRRGKKEWVEVCANLLVTGLKTPDVVQVVSWVEDAAPRSSEPENKRFVRRGVLRQRLEQRLAWLTARARLDSPLAPRFVPDVTACSLEGAGQP